jgi:hypothetical protein
MLSAFPFGPVFVEWTFYEQSSTTKCTPRRSSFIPVERGHCAGVAQIQQHRAGAIYLGSAAGNSIDRRGADAAVTMRRKALE